MFNIVATLIIIVFARIGTIERRVIIVMFCARNQPEIYSCHRCHRCYSLYRFYSFFLQYLKFRNRKSLALRKNLYICTLKITLFE